MHLYAQEELTEVAAVCEVEGMEKPVLLGFCSKAKGLSVSYSLLHTDWYRLRVYTFILDIWCQVYVYNMTATLFFLVFSATSDVPAVLDFTEDEPVLIGKSATRKLLLTNPTAISATFIIKTEVFSRHRSTGPVKNSKPGYDNRHAYVLYISSVYTHMYVHRSLQL